jgi:hypothetical protein
MADKGLSEAEREIIIDKDAKSTGKELCDYIDELIKTAKLQTLEDVWKAMKCDCLHTTVWCANSSPCKVCSLENCPLIKNLREAL